MPEFFGKVWAGIVGLIEDLNESLTAFLKKTRLTSQIKETQKNKVDTLRNLGELVYNLHVNGIINIEQCEVMCDKITSYNAKLRELEEKGKEIDELKITPTVIEPQELSAPDTAVCTDNEDDFGLTSAEM